MSERALETGNNVLLEGDTFTTGEVIGVDAVSIRLRRAAWIPDCGVRMHELAAKGNDALYASDAGEVEPFADDQIVEVERTSVYRSWQWRGALPREPK